MGETRSRRIAKVLTQLAMRGWTSDMVEYVRPHMNNSEWLNNYERMLRTGRALPDGTGGTFESMTASISRHVDRERLTP